MLACALVLGLVERALPPIGALPGVRLGLPNVAILLALYLFPFPQALALTLGKCVLLALLTGSFTSLLYSLAGSLLALGAMTPLVRFSRGRVGTMGVSVVGAVCHNMGQLLCASALMQTFLFPYLPLLLAAGAMAGAAVGLVVAVVLPRIKPVWKPG